MESNPFSLTNWHVDPGIALGTGLLCGLYAYRASALAGSGLGPSRRQVALFAASIATVLVALTSPLHGLSDNYLFSAHMVQHLLLTMAMPPLFLASLTGEMVRPLLRPGWALAVGRLLTRAPVAYALCNVIFVASHLPTLYELTLRNHGVHVLEHLVFMVTAVLLWWPLLSPLPELPRLSYPAQLLYVFLQVLPGMIVGGLIANSPRALYPFYAQAERITSLSAVQDQQLGSVIMWVGGGFFFLVVFTVIWFRWAAPDIAAQSSGPRPLAPKR